MSETINNNKKIFTSNVDRSVILQLWDKEVNKFVFYYIGIRNLEFERALAHY